MHGLTFYSMHNDCVKLVWYVRACVGVWVLPAAWQIVDFIVSFLRSHLPPIHSLTHSLAHSPRILFTVCTHSHQLTAAADAAALFVPYEEDENKCHKERKNERKKKKRILSFHFILKFQMKFLFYIPFPSFAPNVLSFVINIYSIILCLYICHRVHSAQHTHPRTLTHSLILSLIQLASIKTEPKTILRLYIGIRYTLSKSIAGNYYVRWSVGCGFDVSWRALACACDFFFSPSTKENPFKCCRASVYRYTNLVPSLNSYTFSCIK